MRKTLALTTRLTMGVKLAVALTAQAKSVPSATATPVAFDLTEVKMVVQQITSDKVFRLNSKGKVAANKARRIWSRLVFAAGTEIRAGVPMSYDEVRLFLQAYNAGPYACLKYKGTVPYRETRNYVPRVMKYYQQNLANTDYDPIIVEKSNKYGLDPQLVRAIIKTESNFKRNTVSHAGARGLMQVMPVVWREMCKRYKLNWNYQKEVFDPEKNIEIACAYLAWLRYDFLPRHFQEFPAELEAPVYVKRDKRKILEADRISAREQIMLTKRGSGLGAQPGA